MTTGNVYSVGQVNTYIKRMFTQDYLLHRIMVRGEVSNCKYHSSGHIYFTLKDASGTLSCVMFASSVRGGLSFRMEEGDEVVVSGRIDVWVKGGTYSLQAERIERAGVGALAAEVERLRLQLKEMGMFDASYKQPIPRYIRRLGVVTAPTGAAVQDIINISGRRNPAVEIILYPALVQGEGAPVSVANGIHALDALQDIDPAHKVDVIIVGRGGGSLEDLMAFNTEIVAQAIFDCRTPIISAVGHETDTTIADYVADLRAPTPSAGAELAVYDAATYLGEVAGFREQMTLRMRQRLQRLRTQMEADRRALTHLSPAGKVRDQRLELEQLRMQLQGDMQVRIRDCRQQLQMAARLSQNMQGRLKDRRHMLQLCASSLDRLSPLKRLSGGYGFVTQESGAAASAADVRPGDSITIRMRDGRIHSVVTDTEMEELHG